MLILKAGDNFRVTPLAWSDTGFVESGTGSQLCKRDVCMEEFIIVYTIFRLIEIQRNVFFPLLDTKNSQDSVEMPQDFQCLI